MGKRKTIGVILWAVWKTLDDQLIPALDLFERLGRQEASRLDSFMQRDDQVVKAFYHKVAAEAAKAGRCLVDFHARSPTRLVDTHLATRLDFDGRRAR